MKTTLRILLVEDSQTDADLMMAALAEDGIGADALRVETRGQLLNALEKDKFDLVLSDYSLPSFDGFSALALLRTRLPETPFIFVSGTIGEERAIEALRSGATDYVLKHRLSRLAPAVRRAIAEADERTARQAAEKSRAAAESLFRVLFEQVTIGVAITDLAGRIVNANPSFLAMLGLGGSELAAAGLSDLVPTGDAAAAAHQELCAGRIKSYEREQEFERADGTRALARIVVSLIRDEHDAPRFFVNLVEDITERKELEKRFLQAQKMEVVGRLAAGFAHDFNNLLTVINGYSQLLLRKIPGGGPGHRELSEVRRAGERATTLTQRLLTLSRQRAQRSEPLEMNSIITGLSDALTHLAGEKVRLTLQLDPRGVRVQSDQTCIEQIVLNLVINARDAMPDGGALSIATEPARLDGESAARHSVAPGDYLALTVADTGCGMDTATRSRVFEPFFTTKDATNGTGLGLWMVHEIVRGSGGTIDVQSEVGRGTSFRIWLPASVPQQETGLEALSASVGPPALQPAAAKEAGSTILVVDDDPSIRRFMSDALGLTGHRVLEASDGVQAMESLRRHPVDLLITDLVMPDREGLETIQAVRTQFPDLLVIAISGGLGERFLHVATRLGANQVLRKPFSADELTAAVHHLLAGRARVASTQ